MAEQNTHSPTFNTENLIKSILQYNKEIIAGDYYFNTSNSSIPLQETIKSAVESATNIEDSIKSSIETKVKSFKDRRLKNLKYTFDKNSNNFSKGVFDLKIPDLIISEAENELDSFLSEEESNDITSCLKSLKLLYLNIAIAELEENLSCDKTTKDRLDDFLDKVREVVGGDRDTEINMSTVAAENSDIRVIGNILEEKVKFLRWKIEVREFISRNKNFSFRDCHDLLEFGKTKSYFSNFIENCKNHYLLGKVPYCSKPLQKEENNKPVISYMLKRDGLGEIKYEEILKWSRHLRKRLNEDTLPYDSVIEDLKQVLSVFKVENLKLEKEKNKDNDFEKFTLKSANNLIFNTYIRVLLKKEIASKFPTCFEDLKNNQLQDFLFIREIFNQIKDFQDDLKFYDYYPYQYILKFFQEFIGTIREDILNAFAINKDLIDEKNEKELIKKSEDKLALIGDLYSEAIKNFKDKFDWTRERKLNPIYLGESASTINKNSEVIFLDSSYILPDHFTKVEEEWYAEEQYKKVTIRSTKNRVQFEIHRVVTENSVDKKKEEFEKKVKENEFKTVQIVALFVSIATFVLGNIRIFENKTLDGGLSVMFAFAACLLMFNAFFKWLIRDSILANMEATRTVLKEGENAIWNYFTRYKFSIPDGILLFFIMGFAGLSIFFNSQDENNVKLIKEYMPIIWKENEKQRDALMKDIYIDTTQKAKINSIIGSQIKELIKNDTLLRNEIKSLRK